MIIINLLAVFPQGTKAAEATPAMARVAAEMRENFIVLYRERNGVFLKE